MSSLMRSRVRPLVEVLSKQKRLNVKLAKRSVTNLSADNVLSSPFGDVEDPNMTLVSYVFRNADKWDHKPAITCTSSGRSYQYGLARMMVPRTAQALLGACQCQPGEVIGIVLPNLPEFVPIVFGALEAGLIVTVANPLYGPQELTRQFENAGVKLIVTIEELLPVAKAVSTRLPGYRGTISVGGSNDPSNKVFRFQSIIVKDYKGVELPKVDVDDVALIPYSSGTTGLPKGVQLTHRNLVINIEQSQHPDLSKYSRPDNTEIHETALTIPPFFHIYGFNGILNYHLSVGNHVLSLPRFTPESYLDCLLEYRPDIICVVPSLLMFLGSHSAVTPEHLASVKEVMVGAAPLTESIVMMFRQKCRSDLVIRCGYGMTETSPVTLITPCNTPATKVASCGQLFRGTQARVVDLKTGKNLGPYQNGELLVKGPQNMKGYLNNPEATREIMDEDGWLNTGDVVHYDDDGFFYVVDRNKDLIKVKGNQVSPTELENIIAELPGVADVAVIGIPDALCGEVPRAFVVLRPNVKLTESEIQEHVKSKVVKYKTLAGGVRIIKAIPRNHTGKTLRNELRIMSDDTSSI